MRLALLLWCVLVTAFMPMAARANWREAETQHFRLFSNGREAELRKFATMIEDYDQVLRMMTGSTAPASPVKLDVYMVRSNSDLRKVRRVGSTVAGFYSATPGYIAAFAIRTDDGGLAGSETLFHEYAHHFMWQYYPAAYPAWYVEGFAEFMMTANITEKSIEVGRYNEGRAYWLLRGSWLPAERILDGEISRLNGQDVAMFYAQSWLMVHWAFSDSKRSQAIQRYLQARAKGEDGRTAFEREMGMDYREFHRQLRKYVSTGKIAYLRFGRSSGQTAVPVTVRELPASADDLLLPRAAIQLGLSDKRGAAALATVRSSAARYPGDPLARWTHAAYEIDFGEAAAGSAMVDALIAGGMKDAPTLFLRGYGDLVQGRKAESGEEKRKLYGQARLWFARAFRADENYFPALWAYAETRSLDPMNENTLSVLLKAQELAPQVESLRFEAAVALMRSREFAGAVRMIEPLAVDPHDGRGAAHARKLLAMARSGQFTEADLQWDKDAEDAGAADAEDDGQNGGSSPADPPADAKPDGSKKGESKGAAPAGAAPR